MITIKLLLLYPSNYLKQKKRSISYSIFFLVLFLLTIFVKNYFHVLIMTALSDFYET